jgi:hypothetical protein
MIFGWNSRAVVSHHEFDLVIANIAASNSDRSFLAIMVFYRVTNEVSKDLAQCTRLRL